MEVGPAGEILEPKELRGRFYNAIRALVRDKLNPTIPNQKEVPEKKKDELWDKQLKLNFRFPEGKQELVKNAFKIMGESFRHWRSELNKKYIQKGVNSLQRVQQNNSQSMGEACGLEDFIGGIGAQCP